MNLAGTWYNQHGSTMVLTVNGAEVSGTYVTTVGSAQGTYILAGRTDAGSPHGHNVGFVVSWQNDSGNSHSVTSWSGQLHMIGGKERLTTYWILTIETRSKDEWQSHLVGKDVFLRDAPSPESAAAERAAGSISHPL